MVSCFKHGTAITSQPRAPANWMYRSIDLNGRLRNYERAWKDKPVRMPICHCSRCHSVNTIRVNEGLRHEDWYCYDCGRGFDVPIGDPAHRTRVRTRLQSTSTVPVRLNGSTDTDARSLRVK